MSNQTGANILVALRRETVTGVAAGATSALASQMRYISSQGSVLKRAQIQSQEKLSTGLMPMGRLGYKSVDGQYTSELTIGGVNDIAAEAVMRSTFATATSIPFASMTTLAFGSNTITAAGGDFIATQGLRVGDIFTITGTSLAANNNLNYPITALGTLTITTVAGAFTTLAATSTGTLTRAKKVITATTPTRYTHTIEQYFTDMDLSELFLGCRIVGAKYSFRPGAMATVQYTVVGMDRTALATGTSPYFISPVLTTGLSLVADDSTIRKNGATVTTFTGFDLNFAITAKGEPVIGSLVTPDIFDNTCAVDGTITGLRSDFSNLTLFDAETEFEVSILLQEPNGPPKSFLAFFLPRTKISALSPSALGADGAQIETLTLMVGPKTAATGYDGSICTISSSAA